MSNNIFFVEMRWVDGKKSCGRHEIECIGYIKVVENCTKLLVEIGAGVDNNGYVRIILPSQKLSDNLGRTDV